MTMYFAYSMRLLTPRCFRGCEGKLYARHISMAHQKPARTRFAPSPTGNLHLGSLRTALYNYLWAKRTGGQFLLRVEDTDQGRLTPGSEDSLYNNLAWAGLTVDEGPQEGGRHAPYRQSERLDIYREHVDLLIQKGAAYRCFCKPDRLEALKADSRKHGLSGTYDRKCLHIAHEEAQQRAEEGESHVIRLKSPEVIPEVEDIVHGIVNFQHGKQNIAFDDSILIKSDGFPTYHFANVVDDHLMEITHVIRGEEWLPSTPKHLAIYGAFGWTPPAFCHVPLLASVGGAKLSKRHGDTTVEAYREKGYLPESLLNYLALMGWNAQIAPGESEVLTLAQLSETFDLHQITKGAAVVTPEKLQFLQKQHFARLTDSREGLARLVTSLREQVASLYPDETFTDAYLGEVILALRDRVVDPLGIPDLGSTFFQRPDYAGGKAALRFREKYTKSSRLPLAELLGIVHDGLHGLEPWTGTAFNLQIEKFLSLPASASSTSSSAPPSNGMVMGAIRYALCGGQSGAGVKQVMAVLGRAETLARLQRARQFLESKQEES